MAMKRVFLIVLDSCGIGAAPDAGAFGDAGVNTLRSCAESPFFSMPNLISMGLGQLDGVDYLPKAAPKMAMARLQERSMGKDTTIGHWELAGIVSERPLPTYPNGFPAEIIDEFERLTGRKTLCNKPYSGTDVIRDYGAHRRPAAQPAAVLLAFICHDQTVRQVGAIRPAAAFAGNIADDSRAFAGRA